MPSQNVNQDRLNAFIGKFASDSRATLHAPTVIIGEKLSLYKTMAASGEGIFTCFRRATEAPFNRVFEVRP